MSLYDYISGTWRATGDLKDSRKYHSATLLSTGQVLLAGGSGLNSAELYDPVSETWNFTGSMGSPREYHSGTLLIDGRVLVAGGVSNSTTLATAELYDPATHSWKPTGSLAQPRSSHTATLLPNGKVLVAGGDTPASWTAELYDPTSGTWTVTRNLSTPHQSHTGTLLSNGRVLIAGGYTTVCELYDPVTGVWTVVGPLSTSRHGHAATALPDGRVLVAGGSGSSAEVFDIGMGFPAAWRPQIGTSPLHLDPGACLSLTGAGFRGTSPGSGGNNAQDSPTDFPLVQLRSFEGDQMRFLTASNWTTNSFDSEPITGWPPGYALATVVVNSIPSTSAVVSVTVPVPSPIVIICAPLLSNGGVRFSFTNSPGANFAVLAGSNLSQAVSTWSRLGGVLEVSPGQFQFTDPEAASNAQRFYRVCAP